MKTMKKIYVTPKQQVSLTCDECSAVYTSAAPPRVRGNMVVRARCRCGHDIEAVFEYRQAYRKQVSLYGQFRNTEGIASTQMAQVQNLSQSGLQFTTYGWRTVHQGDVITVSFTLDDAQRSRVNKQVEIRHVSEQSVGGQFCNTDQFAYQKEIGFYLMR